MFPLKGLIEKLIKKADSPKTIVEKAIGCVVTENEHRELSKHKKSIGWERYADAKVAVYDMESTPRQYKVTPDGKIIP